MLYPLVCLYREKSMQNRADHHYSMLFIRADRRFDLMKLLEDFFLKERVRAFVPVREYWRRDKEKLDQKKLFPGYIFVCTDMSRSELHSFLTEQRERIGVHLKELGLHDGIPAQENPSDGDDCPIRDLTAAETEYFRYMLDDEGVQRMSYGYIENDRVVVVCGPLKGHEDKIFRLDRRERIAYLAYKFRDHPMVVGLQIKPREFFDYRGD